MKTCEICLNEYEPKHHNQRYCSDQCSNEAKRRSKKKYKKTEKGKASEERWIKSDRRKENEKGYRQKPEARKKAVIRSIRTLKNNPHLMDAKRRRDREYAKKPEGKEVNRRARHKYRKTEKGIATRRTLKFMRTRPELGKLDYKAFIEKVIRMNWLCVGCGKVLNIDTVTVDHIKPLSKGGTHHIDNLQPMCHSCNSSKGNR